MPSPTSLLLTLFWVSPSVLAFRSSTLTTSTTRRRTSAVLKIALDLPLDTFGDVNGDWEEEDIHSIASINSDYYHNDAAQTIFPYLDQWRRTSDDGTNCLVGIVYNHPTYADGQAIATSQLVETDVVTVEEEGIVTTISGTQYLLGHELILELDDWRLTGDGRVQGVLAHAYPHLKLKQGQRITTDPFALHSTIVQHGIFTTENGAHYLLLDAHIFPILEQWKRLDGGSLAGYVYRHTKIADGELITTTPLVELDESHAGMVLVTTASGSQYELGQAEPQKLVEEDYYYEEEDAYDVYYGYEEQDQSSSYDDDIDDDDHHIPTRYIPVSNPLQKIFAAAFTHRPHSNKKSFFNANLQSGGENVTHTEWTK